MPPRTSKPAGPEYVRFLSHIQGPGLPDIYPGAVAREPIPEMLARVPSACWEAIDAKAYREAWTAGRRVVAFERPATA